MSAERKILHTDMSTAGFTLVELMIALLLTSIVVTAVLNTYVNQHKVVLVQEQISDMQQNARTAIDEITRQVRMAGFALPLGLPAIVTSNTNPDTITLNYNASECSASITSAMPQPSAELKLVGQDLSCYYDGMWAYIFHPDSGGGDWFEVTQVQQAAGHIQHNKDVFSMSYPAGAIVMSLDQLKFYIDNSDTTHPKLMVQANNKTPQVYAENIEDLQFQYVMKNGMVVDATPLSADIREVRITIQAHTNESDPDLPNNPYRTRTYSSSVSPRNLGSS